MQGIYYLHRGDDFRLFIRVFIKSQCRNSWNGCCGSRPALVLVYSKRAVSYVFRNLQGGDLGAAAAVKQLTL